MFFVIFCAKNCDDTYVHDTIAKYSNTRYAPQITKITLKLQLSIISTVQKRKLGTFRFCTVFKRHKDNASHNLNCSKVYL